MPTKHLIISVLCEYLFMYFMELFLFCEVHYFLHNDVPFSPSMLAITNVSFDGILGANSGGSSCYTAWRPELILFAERMSEISKDDEIHAECGGEHFSVLRCVMLCKYILYLTCANAPHGTQT